MFDIGYFDYPWAYDDVNTGGSLKSGAQHVYGAKNKYATMNLQEIIDFPLDKVLKPDSILFMWTTTPLKENAAEVMRAYRHRFDLIYKGTIYWFKDRNGKLGMGRYYRGDAEELWYFIRGDIPPFEMQISNVVYEKALAHSVKPDRFRKIVTDTGVNVFNKLLGRKKQFSVLEGFARTQYNDPRWTCIGFSLDRKEIREKIHKMWLAEKEGK